jgi:membrane-associated phospholipid phosphatase
MLAESAVAAVTALAGVPERWRRVRVAFVIAYLIGYVAWLVNVGLIVDRISVMLSVALLLVVAHVGRPPRAWRVVAVDFLFYATMWIVYDETRGAADRVGMPLQVDSVRDIDRFMFGGTDPTVWLQDQFYSADRVHWYDITASIVYYSHFIVPVTVIATLWIRRRNQWVRFMRRFATVLAIACVSFVLLPTAPPWMAGGGSRAIPLDALPPLAQPVSRGWTALGLESFTHVWQTSRDWVNPIAAMPSLHAAFSLMVVVFFFPRVRRRGIRLALLAYPLAMGLALVYLGEHWVVDLLAGWAVVGASFALWNRIEHRIAGRDPGWWRTRRLVSDLARGQL